MPTLIDHGFSDGLYREGAKDSRIKPLELELKAIRVTLERLHQNLFRTETEVRNFFECYGFLM